MSETPPKKKAEYLKWINQHGQTSHQRVGVWSDNFFTAVNKPDRSQKLRDVCFPALSARSEGSDIADL